MAHELIINGELYHYGKKGMKWGKKKVPNVVGTGKMLNAAQQARRNKIHMDTLQRNRENDEQELRELDAMYEAEQKAKAKNKATKTAKTVKKTKKKKDLASVIAANGSKALSALKKGVNNVKNDVEQFGKDVKRVYKNTTSPKVTSDGNLKKGKGGVYTYTEKGKAEALKIKAKVDAEMAAEKKRKKTLNKKKMNIV